MTEHVHEWEQYFATEYGAKYIIVERYLAKCKHCTEKLTIDEGLARINATERLRKERGKLIRKLNTWRLE